MLTVTLSLTPGDCAGNSSANRKVELRFED